MSKRLSKSQREAQQRAARDFLRADLDGVFTIYALRAPNNPRVIRLMFIDDPRASGNRAAPMIRDITSEAAKLIGVRRVKGGLVIGGGGFNPCQDAVERLSHALTGDARAFRCEEL